MQYPEDVIFCKPVILVFYTNKNDILVKTIVCLKKRKVLLLG